MFSKLFGSFGEHLFWLHGITVRDAPYPSLASNTKDLFFSSDFASMLSMSLHQLNLNQYFSHQKCKMPNLVESLNLMKTSPASLSIYFDLLSETTGAFGNQIGLFGTYICFIPFVALYSMTRLLVQFR